MGIIKTSGHRALPARDKKHDLPAEIMDGINAGAINDVGVHGLADSLHISERHLRRIVHDKTGTSPLHFNQAKRLDAARLLVIRTKLPIIDIAFIAEFSSLRQFNDVFKDAFKTSPREMRKSASLARTKKVADSIVLSLKISYAALMGTPLEESIKLNRAGYEKT